MTGAGLVTGDGLDSCTSWVIGACLAWAGNHLQIFDPARIGSNQSLLRIGKNFQFTTGVLLDKGSRFRDLFLQITSEIC